MNLWQMTANTFNTVKLYSSMNLPITLCPGRIYSMCVAIILFTTSLFAEDALIKGTKLTSSRPGGAEILVVNEKELEIRQNGQNLLFTYTFDGKLVRAVGTVRGTTQVLYYSITSEGLKAQDGDIYRIGGATAIAQEDYSVYFKWTHGYYAYFRDSPDEDTSKQNELFTLMFPHFDSTSSLVEADLRLNKIERLVRMAGTLEGNRLRLRTSEGDLEWDLHLFPKEVPIAVGRLSARGRFSHLNGLFGFIRFERPTKSIFGGDKPEEIIPLWTEVRLGSVNQRNALKLEIAGRKTPIILRPLGSADVFIKRGIMLAVQITSDRTTLSDHFLGGSHLMYLKVDDRPLPLSIALSREPIGASKLASLQIIKEGASNFDKSTWSDPFPITKDVSWRLKKAFKRILVKLDDGSEAEGVIGLNGFGVPGVSKSMHAISLKQHPSEAEDKNAVTYEVWKK